MVSAGIVIGNILEAMQAQNDKVMVARVWRLLNNELDEITRRHSWHELRRTLTLDFSAAGVDDTGLWLPANLAGIDRVYDADDEIEFWEVDKSELATSDDIYRYYRCCGSETALFEGQDLALTKGGQSFVSAALTVAGTSVSGSYMILGGRSGFFLIGSGATPFTITPRYWGDSVTSGVFAIRPTSTQKMLIADPDEELLHDRDVVVDYWQMPNPVYLETDNIPLPSGHYLELKVLRQLPEAKPRRPVSQGELDEAWADMLMLNPTYPRLPSPQSRKDQAFRFTSNPFARRD